MLKINEKYPYVYETHLHTSQGSRCGRATGAQMAKACKEAGYTGIIVTDHFFYGNTAIDRSLPWADWVELYAKGYEDAKRAGDEIGLQVFFGWESGYSGTEFLVYGLDKEWLINHPEIKDASIEEQCSLVHADGGMIVHAHPYREEFYIPEIRLYPEYVDAVETVNASHSGYLSRSHNNPEFNVRAMEYAKEYDLPMTAGSDVHGTELLYGGMAFEERLTDIKAFMDAVRTKKACILLDGNETKP